MRFVFFLPYAYDYVREDGSSGGTGERCAQALHFASEVLSQGPDTQRFAILTAGYTKESPRIPSIGRPRSLASEQSAFLRKLGDESLHLADPSGWGTFDETRNGIRIIKKALAMYAPSNQEVHVVVASNPFHLYGRVKLCWHFLKPPEWKLHLVPAHHRFTWKERFQELFLKIPSYFWRFLVKKEHLHDE